MSVLMKSQLEDKFLLFAKCYNLPEPEREYRFMKSRRFRFDFSWVYAKVAVELEGGVYIQGRHTRGKGFENDCEKYNLAQLQGWTVIRLTNSMINTAWIERIGELL